MISNLLIIIGIFAVTVAISYVFVDQYSMTGGSKSHRIEVITDPRQYREPPESDYYQRYLIMLTRELQLSLEKKEIADSIENLIKGVTEKNVDYEKIIGGYMEAMRVVEDPKLVQDALDLMTKLYQELINSRSMEVAKNSIEPEIGQIMSLMSELQAKVISILKAIDTNLKGQMSKTKSSQMQNPVKGKQKKEANTA